MTLKDGELGVVVQRDRATYAVAPHVPCGIVTPEFLRKLADAAEKHGCAAVKITSAQRIALIGLAEEQVEQVWQELGASPGHMTGNRVRSVRACPGTEYCKRGVQDSLGVGLELDGKHHGRLLPGKMKIGVSGCAHQCAETSIKDIGLVGQAKGWTVLVGGTGGARTRIGEAIVKQLSDEEAVAVVDELVAYFEQHARSGQRLYKVIDRLGLDHLCDALVEAMPGIADRMARTKEREASRNE